MMDSIRARIHAWYERLDAWAFAYGNSMRAKAVFGVTAALDAFISPIPADIFFPLLVFPEFKKRWLEYSLITAISSIVGGVIGYVIGAWFFDALGAGIISFYGWESEFARAEVFFSAYVFWAVLFGSFTPFPYQVTTVAAGFFAADFGLFMLASFIGRIARYVLVGFLVKEYGAKVLKLFVRHFTLITAAAVILFVVFEYFGITDIIP